MSDSSISAAAPQSVALRPDAAVDPDGADESLPYDLEPAPDAAPPGEGSSSVTPPVAEGDAVPTSAAEMKARDAARDRDFNERIGRWRETGDELALRPLVDEFARRIERQAVRLSQRGLDQSDVVEAGYTALASTLKEFDTTAGVPFGVLFTQHFAAKVKEQRAQLEGAVALRRKTYQVRSNVLAAADGVRREQAAQATVRSSGYTRDRDVERFTLPERFDEAQFAALFDASGVDGDPAGPSAARAVAWAALFEAVAAHYRRALPGAPVDVLDRAATAKTVPIASARPVSRRAMERSLADQIDYDITMFTRRGAEYDPAPTRERVSGATREFYEAVAHRSGTTPERARALLESFGSTQSFDATPDDSGGKKVGPALNARLADESGDALTEDQVEPIIHGLHLVPTASRVAFVLHMGLDGFRPLSLGQLARDTGMTSGQAERMVDTARAVFADPAVREAVFSGRGMKASPMAAVAETAALWYAEREAARQAATETSADRVADAAEGALAAAEADAQVEGAEMATGQLGFF